MTQTCDICGAKYSSELWKHSTKNICTYCVQIQLLEESYAVFSQDAREALQHITKEIERLLDKQQEEHTLPLIKKGLSFLNGFLIREADFRLLEEGIYWYNDFLKKEGRLESTRFVVDRTHLVGSTRFIVVLYLKDGHEPETWKFFTGMRKV
ncbi:MAG: hypothetical protein GF411_12435 [Candidatus Lokiarchaeota archaeon]|nr:hypothetical protein [Candidatus Lokiarchaeota archaeon]